MDGGHNWTEISPDLARKTYDVPASVGKYSDTPTAKPVLRGVVYAIAPSPLSSNKIWAGTDDGLIWVTNDGGKNWNNATPPQLKPWWKVSILDASHFDGQTAYAAINTLRVDDMRPHLFRTHDNGKTWSEINNGIPDGAPTDVIREDPKRKGLLFAGTETQVYFSVDDGDHWQSLRLNMPASSVRDLQIKGDDVVVATHGRGFLVLDDITPLRQLSPEIASAAAHLYKPATALRIRGDMNPPTPWPPEVPAGKNPPDGAIIDYYLGDNTSGPVTLEILDSAGKLIRKYASTDPLPAPPSTYPVPLYWARPTQALSDAAGHHRFLWDLHCTPTPGLNGGPDADQAVPHNTPSAFTSPWVMPGTYTVKLTANGQTLTQSMAVTMDPRVKTPITDLQAQFRLSKQLYDSMMESSEAIEQINALQKQIQERGQADGEYAKKLEALVGRGGFGRGGGGGGFAGGANAAPTFNGLRGQIDRLLHEIQNADAAPTRQQSEAAGKRLKDFATLNAQWSALKADAAKSAL
jgi:hypothetical protein